MGYTHYWTVTKRNTPAKLLEKTYQQAIAECAKVARQYNAECRDLGFDENRLSGYTAHTKPKTYGGLEINGKAGNAHETFSMPKHFNEVKDGFCKTAYKPYDIVVTACLAILHYRLGNAIQVSSDGDTADWIAGVNLARSVTRCQVPNPIKPELIMEEGKWQLNCIKSR